VDEPEAVDARSHDEPFVECMATSIEDEWFNHIGLLESGVENTIAEDQKLYNTLAEDQKHHSTIAEDQKHRITIVDDQKHHSTIAEDQQKLRKQQDPSSSNYEDMENFSISNRPTAYVASHRSDDSKSSTRPSSLSVFDMSMGGRFSNVTSSVNSFEGQEGECRPNSKTGYAVQLNILTETLRLKEIGGAKQQHQQQQQQQPFKQLLMVKLTPDDNETESDDDDSWQSVLRRKIPQRGRARMIFFNRIPTTHDKASFSKSFFGPQPHAEPHLHDKPCPLHSDNEIRSVKRANIATVVNEILCRRRRQNVSFRREGLPPPETELDSHRRGDLMFDGSKMAAIERFGDATEQWRRKRMTAIEAETKQRLLVAMTSSRTIKRRSVRTLHSEANRLCVNPYRCDRCKVEFTSQVQLLHHEYEPLACITLRARLKTVTSDCGASQLIVV